MELFLLYLFTRLNAIHNTAVTAAIFGLAIGVFASFILLLAKNEMSDDTAIGMAQARKWLLSIGFVALLIALAVPTQKDAAIILAGAGLIEVAKTDTAQRLASKSVQLIEQTLDGYLKDQLQPPEGDSHGTH